MTGAPAIIRVAMAVERRLLRLGPAPAGDTDP